MQIEVVKSKIHRVKVTNTDLNYTVIITVDEILMKTANLIEDEKVSVVNVNNGECFSTYAIRGIKNSGTITLNSTAARKVQKKDILIIMSFALPYFGKAKTFNPWLVFPNETTNSQT